MRVVYVSGVYIGEAPDSVSDDATRCQIVDVKGPRDLPETLVAEMNSHDVVAFAKYLKEVGKRVQAIRLIHKATDWGLRSSKYFVDAL